MIEKMTKISTEAELAQKTFDKTAMIKIDTDAKYPGFDRIKMVVNLKGTEVSYVGKRYMAEGDDRTSFLINLYNSLVVSINKHIDEHPEMVNAAKLSFDELKRIVDDRIGEYSVGIRIIKKLKSSGEVKVAVQGLMDDKWYDTYTISMPEGAVESVLAREKGAILRVVDRDVNTAKDMARISNGRAKRVQDLTDDELKALVMGKKGKGVK